MRNCCITMSEIELFSGELSFGAVNLCFRCSYLKIVFHSNLQSIFLNKKDETCPLVDTNLSASIELSLWSRNRKKTHFALLGSRLEHRFPVRSRVPPKHINSREIGKTCQQKWNFQHQNHDDYDFLITYENETSLTTGLIILFFLNALEHQSNSSRNLTR